MTVIAWDGATLAADREARKGPSKYSVRKIHVVNGYLIGFAGSMSAGQSFIEWHRQGANPEKYPSCQAEDATACDALVITPAGKVLLYEASPYPTQIEDKVYAIGSGSDAALAALRLGLCATDAVKLACDICSGCGMGGDAIELDSGKHTQWVYGEMCAP